MFYPEFIINISQRVSPNQPRNVYQLISKAMKNKDITGQKRLKAYVTSKSVPNILKVFLRLK